MSLTDKLREITNELEATKKEFEDMGRKFVQEKSTKVRNTSQSQKERISKLRDSLIRSNSINIDNSDNNINNNNNNNNEDEALSFNSEEIQMIVEKYQEAEKCLADFKSEYENEKNKWEFDMQRLENYYKDSEQSMKLRIEDLTRINDSLRKEISEVEEMHNKQMISDDQNENYYLLENEELNKKIFELEDNLSKNDYLYKEKILSLKKEIKEREESLHNINLIKDNLNKEIERLNCSFGKKENEIQEKNRIEIDIKDKEILQLIEKIEILNKEILSKKNEINILQNNYDKILKNFESLTKNQGKMASNTKREIERLNNEKEKIKILCNKDINEKINEINILKEKIRIMEKIEAERNGEENPEKKDFALAEILEEENLNENENKNKKENSLENQLNQKEEKIANLEIELNSLKRKVKKNEELENEISHLTILSNTQNENFNKQKEFYEKQINELQKKALNINADLLSQKRRTSAIKSDSSLNPKQMAIFAELDGSLKKINAENKYLKEQIEIIKDELEKNKISRENDVKFYKEELLNTEKAAIDAKFGLATLAFDKDCEIVKYRNLCKKYKVKLASINSLYNNNNNTIGRTNLNNKK